MVSWPTKGTCVRNSQSGAWLYPQLVPPLVPGLSCQAHMVDRVQICAD